MIKQLQNNNIQSITRNMRTLLLLLWLNPSLSFVFRSSLFWQGHVSRTKQRLRHHITPCATSQPINEYENDMEHCDDKSVLQQKNDDKFISNQNRRTVLVSSAAFLTQQAGLGYILDQLPSSSVRCNAFDPEEMKRITIFERTSPSVVFIDTFVERRDALLSTNIMEVPLGSGSGFVWDKNGHIVTNYHVVRNSKLAQVTILLSAEVALKAGVKPTPPAVSSSSSTPSSYSISTTVSENEIIPVSTSATLESGVTTALTTSSVTEVPPVMSLTPSPAAPSTKSEKDNVATANSTTSLGSSEKVTQLPTPPAVSPSPSSTTEKAILPTVNSTTPKIIEKASNSSSAIPPQVSLTSTPTEKAVMATSNTTLPKKVDTESTSSSPAKQPPPAASLTSSTTPQASTSEKATANTTMPKSVETAFTVSTSAKPTPLAASLTSSTTPQSNEKDKMPSTTTGSGEKASTPVTAKGTIIDKSLPSNSFTSMKPLSGKDSLTTVRKVYTATIIGVDPGKDIAVLKIDADPAVLFPIAVGTSTGLRVGQQSLAIGNPFGLDHTLTAGVISGTGREVKSPIGRPISDVIQTDAAINPGNSGGPLLDSSGKIIGMNTAIYSPSGASAGIGFAIPIDTVQVIVDTLIRDGRVIRPVLGISYLGTKQARTLGITSGVLVLDVPPNTPPAKAGLKGTRRTDTGLIELGDILRNVNGRDINTEGDLFQALEDRKPGDFVDVIVQRILAVNDELVVRDITLKIQLSDSSKFESSILPNMNQK